MKTPEQVAQERIAKAAEQFAKAMVELNKQLKEQNRLIALYIGAYTSTLRDVEIEETEEIPIKIFTQDVYAKMDKVSE